ncbi:regulator of microtubule dynamics protein 2 isoform X9 [Choloepus didactylus]|uniref:regulator of microtubule dynamics protein 2 isoform X9 n=1 Tax=Choloepus didactylus TaxID=27675 RepID=UPI00189FE8E8|nr:regulator of microtubule dynamics protein 2 isoform X9 [Choloepus didactylus]
MLHSTKKELILGILVGAAGISLLLWYRKVRKPRKAMNFPSFFPLGDAFHPLTLQDEMPNDHGTAAIFQGRQLQILEKLNELLTSMEELREEIRFLKETMTELEEYVQEELGGKISVHRISPQHRARKRKLATVQSSATSYSSEEAESEGGCCKEDQSFQPNCPEEQVTSDPLHNAATLSLGLKTLHPALRRRSSAGNKSFFSARSTTSVYSPFSGRRCSLFPKLQKSNCFLSQSQSRANFDSQEQRYLEDLNPSTTAALFLPRPRAYFSSFRLSIISCYKSETFFDAQRSFQNVCTWNEMQTFSEDSGTAGAEKYRKLSAPEYYSKHFINLGTRHTSSVRRNTVDAATHRRPSATSVSHPSVSSSCQKNGIATDIHDRHQLKKDLKNSIPSGSQSPNHSPATTHQHPYQSVTFNHLSNAGFPSVFKNAACFIPSESEVTSGSFEDENVSDAYHEDKSSATESPKIRYITANTDTEEQSFPVPQAFNAHIEELNLDILLQKADHLRESESGKMDSFELLCDHKEKFRDEIEFIWRFARAHGDMYELSTNTQEKKHYANLGKTLGERAINRAPMNGYCHLWYAVLCGHVSEFEGLQNRINYGHRFKEHLDKALELLPKEPFLYYLKGRYCYTVSKLSWIEKKMAATLFGKIPSSTVEEALQNFLKAEELHPGFSKSNYMYLAKCYIDLEQKEDALKICNLALLLNAVTKEETSSAGNGATRWNILMPHLLTAESPTQEDFWQWLNRTSPPCAEARQKVLMRLSPSHLCLPMDM